MTMKRNLICIFLLLVTVFNFISCSDDDKVTQTPPAEEYMDKARELLTGDIILSTKATLNGVDKTLLSSGCPTKFSFTWKDTINNTAKISLLGFSVGNMPLTIYFYVDAKFFQLNTWEKDEYPGEGWIKFEGKDGITTYQENGSVEGATSNGSSIIGYVNVLSNKIEFIIDYNMMNVRTETFMQTIDKTRINRFQEEFKQYEIDLEKYKKEHGLS